MFHFQRTILSETCFVKNAEEGKNCNTFQFLGIFQHSVTQFRVDRAAHQAVTIKAVVCCVHFQHFLPCFDSSIDLQNRVKIKGVP
jgi:hypothetical protein